jgi:hypothetical protein
MRPQNFAIALVGFALLGCAAPRPAPNSFEPPYPEFNASGDPILAVFFGRTPCELPDCQVLKVGLVLYAKQGSLAPSTYWLGVVGVGRGNDRTVTQGAWTLRRGVKAYPDALVYELDSPAAANFRYFWRVNEDILLPLDASMTPKVGNGAWGYMLSRYAQAYGPITYR